MCRHAYTPHLHASIHASTKMHPYVRAPSHTLYLNVHLCACTHAHTHSQAYTCAHDVRAPIQMKEALPAWPPHCPPSGITTLNLCNLNLCIKCTYCIPMRICSKPSASSSLLRVDSSAYLRVMSAHVLVITLAMDVVGMILSSFRTTEFRKSTGPKKVNERTLDVDTPINLPNIHMRTSARSPSCAQARTHM